MLGPARKLGWGSTPEDSNGLGLVAGWWEDDRRKGLRRKGALQGGERNCRPRTGGAAETREAAEAAPTRNITSPAAPAQAWNMRIAAVIPQACISYAAAGCSGLPLQRCPLWPPVMGHAGRGTAAG